MKFNEMIGLACAFLLLSGALVQVQPASAQTAQPADLDDVQALESFIDGLMSVQLETHNTVGSVVSVVKDGELIFSKGYGYANLADRTPVDPELTLFRPGSVSKLFTWTAVMKLVEQGRLDLHTDINQYLDFSIPATYEEPITLYHLMTHTPGFEDIGLGTLLRTPEEVLPLGEYLANHMPARVRPPGELAAYSNYGTGLAGYIVERTSGLPFEQYIQDFILQPLEMHRSTFYQPPAPDLASHLSAGYIFEQGRFKEGPFEYANASPAGALSATANDMANFMIAHLQNGRFQDRQILTPETTELMHSQQFGHHPSVSGMTYGWMEMHENEQRIIWHGGDTVYFHTALVLLPEHNAGFYVAYNSLEGAIGSSYFMQAFLDRYYPVPDAPPPAPPQDFSERAAQYAGAYEVTRANQTTYEKVMLLLQAATVSVTSDNLLQVSGMGGQPTLWEEVGPHMFRRINNTELLVFEENEQGQIERMYMGNIPVLAFTRSAWHASPALQLPLLGLMIGLFALSLLVLPAAFFARLPYRNTYDRGQPWPARLGNWALWIFSLLALAFVVGMLVMISDQEIVFGLPPFSGVVLAIPWVLLLPGLVMVGVSLLAWIQNYWTLAGRLLFNLLTLAAVAFLFWLYYWNFF